MSVVVTQRSERPRVTVGPELKCARRFFSTATVAPARPSMLYPSNTWLTLGDRSQVGFLIRAKTSRLVTGSSAPHPVPPVMDRTFWSKRPR